MRKTKKLLSSFLIVAMLSSLMLSGCNSEGTDKIEVELVQYKPEAVAFSFSERTNASTSFFNLLMKQ